MRAKRRDGGFTLLELMVTVVILSILAVVAVASYKNYSRRARTQEAINFLYEIKMKQETYYQAFGQYVTTTEKPGIVPSKLDDGNPIPWEVDCQSNAADAGWCDLGPKSNFNVCPWDVNLLCTEFNFQTVGWAPGAAEPGSVEIGGRVIDPIIRDPSRRWWYAWGEGDLDLDTKFSGFWISSEQNQVIDIYGGSQY